MRKDRQLCSWPPHCACGGGSPRYVVLPYTDFPQLLGLLLRLLNGELAWAMRREVLKVSQRRMRAGRASSSNDSKVFEDEACVCKV